MSFTWLMLIRKRNSVEVEKNSSKRLFLDHRSCLKNNTGNCIRILLYYNYYYYTAYDINTIAYLNAYESARIYMFYNNMCTTYKSDEMFN